ncbi:MAG TPA: DMT family transporter [Clostridiales bacterium]|nr:DMT family transporter [Clostridiales bacterium]
MEKKKAGMAFAVVSATTWGTYGTFYSLLLKDGFTDLTMVALAPLALVIYFGIRIAFKPRVLKAIPLKYYIGMILQGFFLVNAMNYCYAQAYAHGMAVGVVSVIAFTNVLVVMAESYFLFRYRFTVTKIVSMLIAMTGISLVLEIFSGGNGAFTATGLVWTLLIPLFFGTNVSLNTYFIVKDCDSDAILFITQLGALVFMLLFQVHPTALIDNIATSVASYPQALWALLGFCTLPMIACYATMQETLKRIEPSIMSIIYALDPVTSFLLGLIVFAQTIHPLQLLGAGLILTAVTYISFREGREAKTDSDNENESVQPC